MKTIYNLLALTATFWFFTGCEDNDGVRNNLEGLIALDLPYDTMTVEEGRKSVTLSAFGTFYSS